MTGLHDVVVIGGGPAGLAVAGDLARRGQSVVLFERGGYEHPRAGESLGGEVSALLKGLGAWDAMRDVLGLQVPFRAVRSAWGSEALVERHAMLRPHGEGFHVERARFDEALARWAKESGASIRTGAGPCLVRRDGQSFIVRPARGEAARGRFFVDASGPGAPAGGRLGERRWLACDRQVAMSCRLKGTKDLGLDLVVEAVEEGWWYSAPQPGGSLVVVLVSDADLVPAGPRRDLGARFMRALARSVHTSRRADGLAAARPVRVMRAGSGFLLPARSEGWRAVGDAAMSVDPLAGNGVARALRSALEGGGDAQPLATYLDRRDSYYQLEKRWPNAPFWLRRRPGPWKTAAITLNPESELASSNGIPTRESIARAEALVPPAAIRSALDGPRRPEPAHRILERMRGVAPVGDRRLLAGLELLIEGGALRASSPGSRPANHR